jgi:hypothetical protein
VREIGSVRDSLRRMVPQVALAYSVLWSPMRQRECDQRTGGLQLDRLGKRAPRDSIPGFYALGEKLTSRCRERPVMELNTVMPIFLDEARDAGTRVRWAAGVPRR